MALLAEEIVEEWLNRQGFFTIRGIKLGVQEIDLLAIRICEDDIECRHIEVTASVRPMSYLTDVPKEIRKKTGRPKKPLLKEHLRNCRLGLMNGLIKNTIIPGRAN